MDDRHPPTRRPEPAALEEIAGHDHLLAAQFPRGVPELWVRAEVQLPGVTVLLQAAEPNEDL